MLALFDADFLYLIILVGIFVLACIRVARYDNRYGTRWDLLTSRLLAPFDRICQWLQSRSDRRKAGRCLKCGYDLFKNTSGVCPECGTPTHEDRCGL